MAQALIVLNAKLKKENSAKRVGGLFRDLLYFLQNMVLGIILKGERENEATIKAISNPSKGDTYKAKDTGHYWCYDGTRWNDIGEVIPKDVMKSGGSEKTGQNLDDEKISYQDLFNSNLFDKSKVVNGFLDQDGITLIPSDNYITSGPIYINGVENVTSSHNCRFGYLYNSGFSLNEFIDNPVRTIDLNGSSYIRVTIQKALADVFQLEIGTESTEYKEYGLIRDDKISKEIARSEELNAVKGKVSASENSIPKYLLDALEAWVGILLREEKEINITDGHGNVIFKVDNTGIHSINTEALDNIISQEGTVLYIGDPYGNYIFKASNTGIDYIGKAEEQQLINEAVKAGIKQGNYIADVLMIIISGQSLSVAGSISNDTDFHNSIMFQNGVYTNYSFVDDPDQTANYYGNTFVPLNKSGIATPVKFLQKKMAELIAVENNINMEMKEGIIPAFDFQTVGAVTGTGGASMSQLWNQNDIYYKRTLQAIEYGKLLAENENRTFNVPVLCWHQGENSGDSVDPQYGEKLYAFFQAFNTVVKGITGQENDVQFIVYQTCSRLVDLQDTATVPYQLLQLCLDKPDVHFGMAMYQMEYPNYPTDYMHTSNRSYHMQGAMYGVQTKRIVVDKNPNEPIYPQSWNVQEANGKYLLNIKFNVPVRPLKFDKSPFAPETEDENTKPNMKYQPNMGFSILNSGNNEIIQSLAIRREDSIVFECSENPSGLILTYAKNGNAGGGNLSDTQGDTIKANIEGINYRVDNWCPVFKITI